MAKMYKRGPYNYGTGDDMINHIEELVAERDALAAERDNIVVDWHNSKKSEVFWRDGWHALDQDMKALAAHLADAERQLAEGSFYQEKDIDALTARAETAERQRDQVKAIVDDLNITAVLAHALEEDVIADNWAWIFEDALAQQNEALARIKETRDD